MTPDEMRALADQAARKASRLVQWQWTLAEGDELLQIALALRDAADRLDAVQKAAVDALPPYNFELNPDGSENPLSAAYAEGVKDVYLPVMNALDPTPTDQEASK